MTVSAPSGDVVVVGIDFSETAERALSDAIELVAEREGSTLHVVFVAQDYGPTVRLDVGEEMLTMSAAEATHFVGKHVRDFVEAQGAALPEERVIAHVRLGAPSDELVRAAAEVNADLIVVGTHGRTGMKRLLVGSVAEAVVRNAGCPVLVVREKDFTEHKG